MGCSPGKFTTTKVADSSNCLVSEEEQIDEETAASNTDTSAQDKLQGPPSSPAIKSMTYSMMRLTGRARSQAIERLSRLIHGPPLRIQRERSSSQIEFFRQLDEKINRGADFADDETSTCSALSR